MKTYNQTVNGGSFDWNAFLDSAIKGKASKSEQDAAAKRAGSWVTCACGNQCSVLGRYNDGTPQDTELKSLGYDFMDEVRGKHYATAKKTLRAIEARSTKLINQQLKSMSSTLAAMGFNITPIKSKKGAKNVA